jgi:hypothetical protein
MKRSIIPIFSIIAGYVLAILLSVALKAVGIDIPATLAKSSSEYNMYGGVEGLLITIGLSWAIYQVLARRFLEKETPQPTLIESPPVADSVELHTVASANAQPGSVRRKKQWTRPTPLVLAVGVALAWVILSVGPSRFADDLLWVVPHHDIYEPDLRLLVIGVDEGCQPEAHVPQYMPRGFEGWSRTNANGTMDGGCETRWGGDAGYLLGDIVRGGENGLLAFLAIGAALVLWPRLRAASLPSPASAPAPPAVVPTSPTLTNQLRQLQEAHDAGLLSDDEFSTKRSDLLQGL